MMEVELQLVSEQLIQEMAMQLSSIHKAPTTLSLLSTFCECLCSDKPDDKTGIVWSSGMEGAGYEK